MSHTFCNSQNQMLGHNKNYKSLFKMTTNYYNIIEIILEYLLLS